MLTRRELAAGIAAAAVPAEVAGLRLLEAGEKLRRRAVSSVELTRACLARVETLNPSLNAFITVTAETAMEQARAADKDMGAGRRRGPLHGIPIALKDLFDTAGVRTTAASAQFAARVPVEDAEVVQRLKAAGAVILGKLNMDEFAYNFTAETSYFGPSRNPWDTRRTPGGSSGGSAVAVAAGMCFAALGSDTGGSIRLPASFCGVTGLKPTYGLISTRGVLPLAWSLDHVGPLCRSAADTAAVLAVLSGREAAGAAGGSATGMRVGLPRGTWFDQMDAEVKRIWDDALKAMEQLGGKRVEVDLPALKMSAQTPELPEAYLRIIQAEAYTYHEEMARQHPERYHAGTLASIRNGAKVATVEYIRARLEMDRLRGEVGSVFGKVDVVVTPTAPAAAFELGKPAGLVFLRNTAPWNFFGLPTLSIPCGFTAGGLPVGFQIAGAAGREDTILKLAEAYQQATNWHTRRPEFR